MFILDKPYVSDFLLETIIKNKIPVLKTKFSESLLSKNPECLISEKEAVLCFKNNQNSKLYTNSENAIAWIEKHLNFSSVPEKIKLFKDKVQFRELLKTRDPNYFFKSIALDDLDEIDVTGFPLPFILKPATGFFSMGVYKIDHTGNWKQAVIAIKREMHELNGLYPQEVLNTSAFIVEEFIQGDEYAIDCYYDDEGKPVILNILKHLFASDEDTSDRVYITSKDIIQENYKIIEDFLFEIGALTNVKNFPTHVEVRINEGKLFAIEFNPLRFGGWCTTADITKYSYGINSYEYYQSSLKPNWAKILEKKEDELYSIIVLDNSTGLAAEQIKSFDFNKLKNLFRKPLEIRKINHREYPLFGFVFTETEKNNLHELKEILHSDLSEFVHK